MRIFLAAFLFVAACGGKSAPAPNPDPEPDPDPTGEPEPVGDGDMMTVDDCEATGGQVVGDIGDGNVACPDDTEETGKVSGGVETQLCCVPLE